MEWDSEVLYEQQHLSGVMNNVYAFLTRKNLCDLTVYVENESFELHKCIFAAACPLLQYLILQGAENCDKLELNSISALGFKAVLGYIYTGKFPRDSQLRDEFVNACEYLSLPYPCFENERIRIKDPSMEIQVVLLPLKNDGVLQVILKKSDNLTDSHTNLNIPDEAVTDSADENNLPEPIQIEITDSDVADLKDDPNAQSDSVFELVGGVTLTVQKSTIDSKVLFSSNQNQHLSNNAIHKSDRCHNCSGDIIEFDIDSNPKRSKRFCSSCGVSTTNIPMSSSTVQLSDDADDVMKPTNAGGNFPKKMLFYSSDGVVRPYVCQICGTGFTRKHSLKVHLETVCQSRNPVKCLMCGKKFASEVSFKGHARKQHKGQNPKMVHIPLKEHLPNRKEKTEWESARYQCKNCASFYHSQQHFMVHLEKCKVVTSIKCPHCAKLFKVRREFDKHLWQCQNIHKNTIIDGACWLEDNPDST